MGSGVHLQLQHLGPARRRDGSELEVDAHGGDVGLAPHALGEAEQEARLAGARVADAHQFQDGGLRVGGGEASLVPRFTIEAHPHLVAVAHPPRAAVGDVAHRLSAVAQAQRTPQSLAACGYRPLRAGARHAGQVGRAEKTEHGLQHV